MQHSGKQSSTSTIYLWGVVLVDITEVSLDFTTFGPCVRNRLVFS